MSGTGAPAALDLAAGFPAQGHQEWQRLVAAVVNKSRPPEKQLDPDAAEASLASALPGGLEVQPLYQRTQQHALGVPGRMPFTRGTHVRASGESWDVRQLHDDPDAALTREAVLTDLEHGVTSVWLHAGSDGLAPAAIAEALTDVQLDLAPVVVSSWDDQDAAADALQAVLTTSTAARGNLGLDPLGGAARTGTPAQLDALAPRVAALQELQGIRAITVDARIYRDAGGSAPDEIGYAIATAVEYVRALAAAGIEPATAFAHIDFRLSATADQFLTIAALRALRTLWARVGEVCGVPEAERGARIHAVTALRMFTRDDPWVNVLRSTIATFAAGVGGAEAITVLPYDTVAGLPEKFSRRLARNTQIVLADEANIARVTDPAGGAYFVEDLTRQVESAAWALFQEVEGGGGMAAALADGSVAQRLSAQSAADAELIASRRQPITGVSMFPLAGEQPTARRPRTGLPADGNSLVPRRDSQIYEDLRNRAGALGADATIALVALGTRRDFGPREMFASNLLGAGGLSATLFEGEEAAATAAAAKPAVAVIASSPKGYAAHAADAVATLRDAGVAQIHVAGRATELGESAVDGELYDGMDVAAYLSTLLDQLGAPADGDQA